MCICLWNQRAWATMKLTITLRSKKEVHLEERIVPQPSCKRFFFFHAKKLTWSMKCKFYYNSRLDSTRSDQNFPFFGGHKDSRFCFSIFSKSFCAVQTRLVSFYPIYTCNSLKCRKAKFQFQTTPTKASALPLLMLPGIVL